MPGDPVYYRRDGSGPQEGPFVVASVPAHRKYTLAEKNGKQVIDGNEVDEQELEEAS